MMVPMIQHSINSSVWLQHEHRTCRERRRLPPSDVPAAPSLGDVGLDPALAALPSLLPPSSPAAPKVMRPADALRPARPIRPWLPRRGRLGPAAAASAPVAENAVAVGSPAVSSDADLLGDAIPQRDEQSVRLATARRGKIKDRNRSSE